MFILVEYIEVISVSESSLVVNTIPGWDDIIIPDRVFQHTFLRLIDLPKFIYL